MCIVLVRIEDSILTKKHILSICTTIILFKHRYHCYYHPHQYHRHHYHQLLQQHKQKVINQLQHPIVRWFLMIPYRSIFELQNIDIVISSLLIIIIISSSSSSRSSNNRNNKWHHKIMRRETDACFHFQLWLLLHIINHWTRSTKDNN